MKNTWLEVALNGPWKKERQPNIPIHPDDIICEAIECVKHGASIIHYHAYDHKTGNETTDVNVHSYIINGILSEVKAIIYPGIVTLSEEDAITEKALDFRYNHVQKLAKENLIDWMVVDPGTCHFTVLDDVENVDKSFLYINSNPSIKAGLDIASEHDIIPSYAIYEPGFIRLGHKFSEVYKKGLNPIYRFMFSDQFSFGFPPSEFALQSYEKLLKELNADANWMIAGLGVDIEPLVKSALTLGGHIRTGLEDYLLGTDHTNISLTKITVEAIKKHGGQLAAPKEIRSVLNVK